MAPVDGTDTPDAVVAVDSMSIAEPLVRTDMAADSTLVAASDSVPSPIGVKRIFNPDPNRALWLSVLCPGLGQIYNRRYWKVPIVVGGYVGLAYATSWNNRMLSDYTKAYRDIMDSDPNTKSYMDFYPSTTKEEDIDKTWLTKALKSKKTSIAVTATCVSSVWSDFMPSALLMPTSTLRCRISTFRLTSR